MTDIKFYVDRDGVLWRGWLTVDRVERLYQRCTGTDCFGDLVWGAAHPWPERKFVEIDVSIVGREA